MLDLSRFIGKTSADSLTAEEWNTFGQLIQDAINSKSDGGAGNSSPFRVNGSLVTPVGGVVNLTAEGTYRLSGTLNGRVTIGSAAAQPAEDTIVILDGVTVINSDTANSAIDYLPELGKMVVTVANNTNNALVCNHEAERADSQRGALHSENNLVVQGGGYLSCINNGGHGIKGSELRISGKPHIYVEAIHDGVHGNKMLVVDGGLIYVNGANDAFGTRAADPDSGKTAGSISIFGGEFYAYNILQRVFDSKAPGHIYRPVAIHTNVVSGSIYDGISVADPKVLFGDAVQDNVNGGYTTPPTGSVTCYTDEALSAGAAVIEPIDGTYTLTTKYAKVSGYVDGNITTSIQSTDITLDNAYIQGNIEYTATKKKLQINLETGSVGIVAGNVTSASNLAIEAKKESHCMIHGNVTGDELTFNDSKGSVIVCGDVVGKDIYIATAATPDPTKKLWGALIVEGTLKAILNSKFVKGNIHVLNEGLVGSLTAGCIDVCGYADMDSVNVSYYDALGIVNGIKTRAQYDIMPYSGTNI